MDALPLQGIAAWSMLSCEQAAHATVSLPAGHDHAAHGHGVDHDHARHAHGGDGSSVAQQLADAGAQPSDGAEVGLGLPADGHACPICASCCNLVALSEAPTLSRASDSPLAQPLQGPARVQTRDAPTPGKPPRA